MKYCFGILIILSLNLLIIIFNNTNKNIFNINKNIKLN